MDDTIIETADIAAELFIPSTSAAKERARAPRGFDPAAMFLLRVHYPNLFEPISGRVGKVRCKGCRQEVTLSRREAHWKGHKRQATRGDKPVSPRYRDTTTKSEPPHNQGGHNIMATATASKTNRPLKTMVARDVAVRVLKKAAKPMDTKEIVAKVMADAKVKEMGIPEATIATQIGRAVGTEDPARIARFGRGKYIAAGVDYTEPEPAKDEAPAPDVTPDPKPASRGKKEDTTA